MSTIELAILPVQPALSISARSSTLGMGRVMSHAYKALYRHAQSHGIACGPENMPYCIYRNLDWERVNSSKGLLATFQMMFLLKWDLEIGIPVPEGTPTGPGMNPSEFPGGRYLKALHRGPYHKTGHTYKIICDYAKAQGYTIKDYSIERYLNSPEQFKPNELLTEVLVPVQ